METLITSGQKKQFLRFTEDAAEKVLEQIDIGQDGMQRLIERGDDFQKHLIGSIREFFIANQLGSETYHLSIDYRQSLADMIASGHYDWKNDDINKKNFPVEGSEVVEVDALLIHLNRSINPDNTLKELDRMGYRPATLPELLAFGRQHPELQRQFPIIALGSVWQSPDGVCRVACLDGRDGGRDLRLFWFGTGLGWVGHCRFLAVRKSR